MSKKNLEDELKNTKDALQCQTEFSSMRKLEIKCLQTTLLEVTHMDVEVVTEGLADTEKSCGKQQMKIESEIEDTRFVSLMDAHTVNVI